jgi:hypothetical protein
MSDGLDIAKKAIKKAAGSADGLLTALRAIDKAGTDPFARVAAVGVARKALIGLRGLDQTVVAVEGWLEAIGKEAGAEAERSKAQLMGELDEALRRRGLRLSGRLPTLEVGPLTLELALGVRAELAIWYGPKVAHLDTAPLDAERAAAMVASTIERLNAGDWDDQRFLQELEAAWRCAVARAGVRTGERIPIIDVLGEMAAGRQSKRWRNDPTRAAYKDYTRVQFSHDLSRLNNRRLPEGELQLTVATRDQTKKAGDHIWVGGTHFAFVAFRSL